MRRLNYAAETAEKKEFIRNTDTMKGNFQKVNGASTSKRPTVYPTGWRDPYYDTLL